MDEADLSQEFKNRFIHSLTRCSSLPGLVQVLLQNESSDQKQAQGLQSGELYNCSLNNINLHGKQPKCLIGKW